MRGNVYPAAVGVECGCAQRSTPAQGARRHGAGLRATLLSPARARNLWTTPDGGGRATAQVLDSRVAQPTLHDYLGD